MKTSPAGFLVWIAGRNGRPPAPEIWPVDAIGAVTNHAVEIARYPLDDLDVHRSLSVLAARYPAPPDAPAEVEVKIA